MGGCAEAERWVALAVPRQRDGWLRQREVAVPRQRNRWLRQRDGCHSEMGG